MTVRSVARLLPARVAESDSAACVAIARSATSASSSMAAAAMSLEPPASSRPVVRAQEPTLASVALLTMSMRSRSVW
jgi:hypothetical protein